MSRKPAPQIAPQPARKAKTMPAVAETQYKGPGRPGLAPEGSERVTIRMPIHLLAEVDAVIAARGNVTDRATVIRELVVEGLKAQKRWGK